ncbi:Hint domain-containing protein [Pelagovum pacificum]|nr:Hint domain-containing protein [Pelagovum pacificum]QQA42347.1 Hint domain-containing protein [Pelagovum pacificum]
MTTYWIDASNWNSPTFWSTVCPIGTGHVLDFSALGPEFFVALDPQADCLYLSDGGSKFYVGGMSARPLQDACLGDGASFDQFHMLTGGDGEEWVCDDEARPPVAAPQQEPERSPVRLRDWTDLGADRIADLSSLSYPGDETGLIRLDDGTLLEFPEIESVICFAAGTRIATARGARPIEDLCPGDLVITSDHGLRPIRWVGSRTVPGIGALAPIRFRTGTLVGQSEDIVVSPQHRMLIHGYRAELLYGDSEVLVTARHLVDGTQVLEETRPEVTYHHIMFDEHEIVYAEGAAAESFHPGQVAVTSIEAAAREELFRLFPELRTNVGSYGDTARRCLNEHEVRVLQP